MIDIGPNLTQVILAVGHFLKEALVVVVVAVLFVLFLRDA